MNQYLWNMQSALLEAEKAYSQDEVPVGAVVVDEAGKVLSMAHNQKEKAHNPCGHAEILAIQEACKKEEDWRLNGCTLFVTLEPCTMCMGAIIQARIKTVIFGAYDQKGGAISLGFNIHQNNKLNHQVQIMGGVRHFECSKILSDFFRLRRGQYAQTQF